MCVIPQGYQAETEGSLPSSRGDSFQERCKILPPCRIAYRQSFGVCCQLLLSAGGETKYSVHGIRSVSLMFDVTHVRIFTCETT